MIWKSIQINNQNIKAETSKSVLIQMPHNSDYDGYSFWHLAKLVRTGKHSYAKSLSYNDEFTFRLIKYGNGKHNKFDIIDEEEIGVDQFEEAFGIMNENINVSRKDTESYLIIEEPEKIDKEVKVLDELKNDKH